MKPLVSVSAAITLAWSQYVLGAFAGAIDCLMGGIPLEVFLTSLLFLAVLSVLPYQMQRGKNWARWGYLAVFLLSLPSMFLLSKVEVPPSDFAIGVSWLSLLLDIPCLIGLFSASAKAFFVPSASR